MLCFAVPCRAAAVACRRHVTAQNLFALCAVPSQVWAADAACALVSRSKSQSHAVPAALVHALLSTLLRLALIGSADADSHTQLPASAMRACQQRVFALLRDGSGSGRQPSEEPSTVTTENEQRFDGSIDVAWPKHSPPRAHRSYWVFTAHLVRMQHTVNTRHSVMQCSTCRHAIFGHGSHWVFTSHVGDALPRVQCAACFAATARRTLNIGSPTWRAVQLWDALDAEGAGVNALPDEAIKCRKVKPGTAQHSSCLRIRRQSADIASAHVACFGFVFAHVASVARFFSDCAYRVCAGDAENRPAYSAAVGGRRLLVDKECAA